MSIDSISLHPELDLPVEHAEDVQLTESQVFGLAGDTIDIDAASAQGRLHEASEVTIEDASVELQEKVIEAVPHTLTLSELEQVDQLVRRTLVIAKENRRRRRIAKPILSLAVSYPSSPYRY
jgi:hypothetical protein